ncbi:MAG: FG-GAP repeat protein [Phycisphaerales bacterium]|nr:FG-GAP repeat protein [Phycisphaerales bacterium]
MIHPTPNRRPAIAAISLTAVLAMPAAAQTIYEDYKVFPHDGEHLDFFGVSAAIHGSVAVIGAPTDDDNGMNSGSAYLYDTTNGQLLFKLLPEDGAQDDEFGWDVAISSTTIVVGAKWDDDNGADSGSAYLFDRTTGQQIVKLLPDDGLAGDWFGSSVAIRDNVALIGANKSGFTQADPGAAYLFNATTGQQIAKLIPEDSAPNDRFGSSVAISGDIALIGAPGCNNRCNNNDANPGSAYLFDINTRKQIAKLMPNDAAESDSFGGVVALSDNLAIIGAPGNDDNGVDSGSAYLFDLSTGQQIAKLLPTDGASDDNFGWSVAINGTTAVVGAWLDDDNAFDSGSAYLFDTTTSKQLAKLMPSDGMKSSFFGAAVAIDGTTALVGAVLDYGNDENSGSVYVFTTEHCPADLTNDGTLDSFDVSAFLTAYNAQDPTADFNADGSFNFFDVSAFVEAYLNGCP